MDEAIDKVDAEQAKVTDAEIERILAENEAGIGALLAAYEPIEQAYFSALAPVPPTVTYSINT